MLLDLFLCFVQVGLFSIGGGYAAMPMIQAKAVEHYHWLTMGEFTDLMTIAEMTPGPITVNSATFVGIRMAGIPGALVATMGCILPSLIIVSLLSWLYEKYRSMDAMQAVLACLRPAVVALIASAALTILRVVVFAGGVVSAEAVQMLYVALFAAALVVLRVKHSNPILVMVCCGAVSLIAKFIAGWAAPFLKRQKRRVQFGNAHEIFRFFSKTPCEMKQSVISSLLYEHRTRGDGHGYD